MLASKYINQLQIRSFVFSPAHVQASENRRLRYPILSDMLGVFRLGFPYYVSHDTGGWRHERQYPVPSRPLNRYAKAYKSGNPRVSVSKPTETSIY